MQEPQFLKQEITFDKAARWIGIILLILTTFYVVNYLSSVLLPFFIAWLFAYLLYPIVKFIQYNMHVKVRALAIILTLILVVVVIGALYYAIIPPMLDQFARFEDVLNRWLGQTTHSNSLTTLIKNWFVNNQVEIEHFLKSKDFNDAVKTTMPKVFNVLGQTASIVISIIASMITLLYMFFILLDYEGQGLVALIMGIMFCIGFTIIGFPMGIGLGILIGILDLVPYLHTFALIPTAFLAMLKAADTGENFWIVFGSAVLVFIIVQIITDFIVTPKVMGKAMGLNPAVLLLSLSVWGAVLGFIGLIIALPLTTLIMAYWQRYVTREHEETPQKQP